MASAAVGRLFRSEIASTIRATASAFAEPTLRSLDVIHLATAQILIDAGSAPTNSTATSPSPWG